MPILPSPSMLRSSHTRPATSAAAVGLGMPINHFFIDLADQGVKQRQPQRGAGAIDESDAVAEFAELGKLPVVNNQRGGDAEADHIGQAVELFAERALAVGPAGDAAVHAVEQHGDEHGDGGVFRNGRAWPG